MINYEEEYLAHHGTKGQRWHVKNGPPYPLDAKGQLKKVKSLNGELNKWKYGVVIDGKVETDPSKVDWSRYKTHPIDVIEKHHAGICWDFVNYQHHIFKKNGYPDESYMFVMQRSNNPNDIVTHTFSTVNIGGKKYWFESSWFKHQGVHEVASYKDVVDILRKEYGSNNAYDVYKYNPDGLDKGLTNGEFFRRTTNNLVEYYDGKKNEGAYLAHHGVKNQRWGVRRFQNPDGSLTAAGKLRYSVGNGGKYISKKIDTKSAAKLKKLQVKEAAKLERLKIKEAAKNEKYKEKLDKKKSHITNKEYVKTLSDEKLKAINNRDIAEKLWLKNNPEKKTVGRYIADDLLKPAFEKAMKEQFNNYVSKFVNYSTKKVVDSILNSPSFKEKSSKK